MTTMALFLFQQRVALTRSRGNRGAIALRALSFGAEHGKEVSIMKRTLAQRLARLAIVAAPFAAFALAFAGGKLP